MCFACDLCELAKASLCYVTPNLRAWFFYVQRFNVWFRCDIHLCVLRLSHCVVECIVVVVLCVAFQCLVSMRCSFVCCTRIDVDSHAMCLLCSYVRFGCWTDLTRS